MDAVARINSMRRDLAAALLNNHPTLVQMTMAVFLDALRIVAEQPASHYDLRSEALKRFADRVKPIVDETHFPFI